VVQYCSQFRGSCLLKKRYKSGNPCWESGLTSADLHLCLYQIGSENLISSMEEILRQKGMCHHLKTNPGVMK
jgi:hypothetical protein